MCVPVTPHPPPTQCMMFMCGGRIGFFGGDIKQLIRDIQTIRPTLFVSVPRLLNRIYDRVREGERGRGGGEEIKLNWHYKMEEMSPLRSP